jgi:hypothetical protein
MVRSEGNTSLKNPVTPPGIDPGTVRLVEQRLNRYATPRSNVFLICDEDRNKNEHKWYEMCATRILHWEGKKLENFKLGNLKWIED